MQSFITRSILPLAVLATASLAQPGMANDRVFSEQDGLVVMEIENTDVAEGWVFETNDAGYTGTGYLTWRGPQSFNSPGRGEIIYRVNVTNPGDYNIRLRCRRNTSIADADNDVFLKVNDHGWEKLYTPGTILFNWSWDTRLEEVGHQPARYYLHAGENIISFSGRSQRFEMDRLVAYLDGVQDPLNLGIPESSLGGSVEGDLVYDFARDSQGWSFQGPGSFTRPEGTWTPENEGNLLVTTDNNTNTFGWWESPSLEVPPGDGFFPLMEAQWRVSSNVPASNNPTLRFRVGRPDFSETFILESISSQDGAFSPYADGRTYRQFFSMVDGNLAANAYFDVLNDDPFNAAISTQSLDFLSFTHRSSTSLNLLDPSVAFLDFRGNARGFEAVNVTPTFTAPTSAVESKGLMLTGADASSDDVIFGFWTGNTGVNIEPNSLYEVRFTFTSNAALGDLINFPTTRVRINDSRYYSAHSSVFESTGISLLPQTGSTQTARVWIASDAVMQGSNFLASFDYLYVPGTDNDKDLKIYLQDINIARFELAPATQ